MMVRLAVTVIVVSFVVGVVHCQVRSAVACSRNYFSGEGILESYNFPFNYRDRIDCDYYIQLDDYPTDSLKHVCFTFRRFEIESAYDFVIFHRGESRCQYDNKGTLSQPTHDIECPLNVWPENLCWNTTEERFRVQFTSDQAVNRKGFFATYKTTYETILDDIGHIGPEEDNQITAFGQSSDDAGDIGRLFANSSCVASEQWRCFNRRCISSEAVCNQINNCGDSSDESYAHARCAKSQDGGSSMKACDFQDKSSCQLDGFGNGWVLDEGNSDSGKGPSADHTTGDKMGGFFTRTKFWASRDRYTPDVTLFDLTHYYDPNQDYCLSFFYHMAGHDVGRLQVDLQLLGSYTITSVWSRFGNYSRRWLRAEIPILAKQLSGFAYTKVKATRGGDFYTQVAIDDFYISDGHCRGEDVSCNFEIGTCGWEATDGLVRTTADSSHSGPKTDKSSEDGYGYYLMWQSGSDNDIQTLTSPVVTSFSKQSNKGCLIFWHYNTPLPYDVGRFVSPLLKIKKRFNNNSTFIIYDSTQQTVDWSLKTLDVIEERPFQLIFEWTSGQSGRVVAIDQISLIAAECSLLDLTSCSPVEYRCGTGECIPMRLACDGSPECPDGSDELPEACCTLRACPEGMYCCRNSECIDSDWVCDGDNDCKDWSDEDHCDGTCPDTLFQCGDNGRCINRKYLCNGFKDCKDGSDEHNCSRLPYVSPAILAVVVVLGIILLILVFVKVGLALRAGTCRLPFRRSRRPDEEESEGNLPDPALYQRPPEYSEVVNNPAYLPARQGGKVDEEKPPGYDRVVKGEFVQLQSATARELEILRNQLKSDNGSSAGEVNSGQSRPYVLAYENSAFEGELGSIDHPPHTNRPSSTSSVSNNIVGSGDISGAVDNNYIEFLHPGEENSPPAYTSRPPSRHSSTLRHSFKRQRRHSDGFLAPRSSEPRDLSGGHASSHLVKLEARILRHDTGFVVRRSQKRPRVTRVASEPNEGSQRDSQVNYENSGTRQQSWTTV